MTSHDVNKRHVALFLVLFFAKLFKYGRSNISKTSSDPASDRELSEIEVEEDFGVVGRPVAPYCFEPVAPEGYEEPDEDEDEDGLTPEILEARIENEIPLDTW